MGDGAATPPDARNWLRDVLVPHALLVPFLLLAVVGVPVLWLFMKARAALRAATGGRPLA